MDPDLDTYLWLIVPDPGGPKTYGSARATLKISVSGLWCQSGRRGYPGRAGTVWRRVRRIRIRIHNTGFTSYKDWWHKDSDPDTNVWLMDPDPGGPKTYGSESATLKKSVSGLWCQAGRCGYPGGAGWRCDGGCGGHRHQHAGRFRREPRRFFRHRSRRNLAVQPLPRKVLVNTGDHWLNMEFVWAPVYSCIHWLRPRNSPPPPAFGPMYEGAIGQPKIDIIFLYPLPVIQIILHLLSCLIINKSFVNSN
jgi:hypothetical protein